MQKNKPVLYLSKRFIEAPLETTQICDRALRHEPFNVHVLLTAIRSSTESRVIGADGHTGGRSFCESLCT